MTSKPKPTSADLRALLDSGEWKMVPKVLTREMSDAAYSARDSNGRNALTLAAELGADHAMPTLWAALIAAAPSTEGDAEYIGQQEEGADR